MNKKTSTIVGLKALVAQRNISICIIGESMRPALNENDVVEVTNSATYDLGDILVFSYKGELLIHRLLKVDNEYYYCKGDNAFRVENISPEAIIGKVVKLNGKNLPSASLHFLKLSYLMHKEFRLCGYNAVKITQTPIYKFYKQIIEEKIDSTLKYQRSGFFNSNFEQLSATSYSQLCNRIGSSEVEIMILNGLTEAKTMHEIFEDMKSKMYCGSYDIQDLIKDSLIKFVALGIIRVTC